MEVTEVDAVSTTRRVVVLDDDPTGTQTVRDVPVLTRWTPDDVRWAFAQSAPGFFVLTNTRSLGAAEAARRNREVASVCLSAAREAGLEVVFCSRSDSTLRGHFPLETDVLAEAVRAAGGDIDGIVLCPAYPAAGRVTIDGTHYLRSESGLTPVAESEFARDATYGYRSSRLADWVEEKSAGRIPARSVAVVDLPRLRGPSAGVVDVLRALRDGAVVAVDIESSSDLRKLAEAVLEAESAGARLLYRVGPPFVSARLGQGDNPPLSNDELAGIVDRSQHGLVVVGSHVGLTSRQLDVLKGRLAPAVFELDVVAVLDDARAEAHLKEVAAAVVAALTTRLCVLSTSRNLVRGADAEESLDIARRVSAALTSVTREVVHAARPGFLVAKGGITSSDLATGALGLDRAFVRGSLLPGIVSLWSSPAETSDLPPYVVFAGNVGDDNGLADVVQRLEGS